MLTIVTGAPCSGKSSYVAAHRMPGDVTIDLDEIARALGSPVTHGHPEPFRKIALDARDGAIAGALRHHGRTRIWVIDTAPPEWRMTQYRTAGARFVNLAADKAELHRRADAERRPPEWHAYIEQHLSREEADRVTGRRTRW